jgi:hypothetical protein
MFVLVDLQTAFRILRVCCVCLGKRVVFSYDIYNGISCYHQTESEREVPHLLHIVVSDFTKKLMKVTYSSKICYHNVSR